MSRLQEVTPVLMKRCKRIAISHCDKILCRSKNCSKLHNWLTTACMFVHSMKPTSDYALQSYVASLLQLFVIFVTWGCLTWEPQTLAMPTFCNGPRYSCWWCRRSWTFCWGCKCYHGLPDFSPYNRHFGCLPSQWWIHGYQPSHLVPLFYVVSPKVDLFSLSFHFSPSNFTRTIGHARVSLSNSIKRMYLDLQGVVYLNTLQSPFYVLRSCVDILRYTWVTSKILVVVFMLSSSLLPNA